MGIFQYVDSQTGKGYDFTISGENPSDVEFAKIAQILQRDREEDRKAYKDRYGADLYIDDGTALGRSLARGTKQIKGAVGETIGTIGEQTGLGFLEKYGTGVEERAGQQLGLLSLEQPKRLQSSDVDSIGSALTYAGEVVGEQIPQLGLGLGAAVLGTVAAPVLAPVLGAAAPFVAGATAAGLATAPILFGNNIQRQEDEVAAGTKDRVDVGDALTATFGQATLEGVADKLLLGGFKLLKPVGSTKEGWKGVLTRTGSRATGGAGTESLTEVGQQMLERAQAGLPIDSDDAIAEYREAAIAGGLIGGGTRATLGAFGEGRSAVPTPKATLDTSEEISAPTPTVIDDEILNNLGVLGNSPFRQKVLGKPIADKDTQALLRKYAKNTIIRNQQPDLAANIEALINGQPKAKGIRTSVSSGPEGLANVGDESGKRGNSGKPTTSNLGPVGTDLSNVDESGGSEGSEPNTLDKFLSASTDSFDRIRYALNSDDEYAAGEIKAAIMEAEGKEYNFETANKVELADVRKGIYDKTQELLKDQPEEMTVYRIGTTPKGEVKSFTTNPEFGKTFSTQLPWVDGEGDLQAFKVKKADILGSPDITARGPIGEDEVIINVDNVTSTTIPKAEDVTLSKAAENLKQQVEEGLIKPNTEQGDRIRNERARYKYDKNLNRLGGPFIENDRTVLDDESTQKDTTQEDTTGEKASDPYDAMLDAPDVSREVLNSQAQEALNVRFFTPQKRTKEGIILTKAREFHESTEGKALFDTGDPDLTTLEDKQVILSLLDNPAIKEGVSKSEAKELKKQLEGAVAFFSKYRRLDIALDQIGALSKIGDGKNNVSMKTVADAKKASTKDAFYFDQTKKRAIPARLWVENNMSPQANSIMKSASKVYGRDTSAYIIPDDIRIGDREATYDYASQDKEDARRKYNDNRTAHNFEIISDDKAIIDDGVEFVDDSIVGYDLDAEFFLLDPVQGLNTQLLPDAKNGLRNNNIKAVLLSIAGTNPVPRIRQIAGKLANVVGTTQVQVVDDLAQMTGYKTDTARVRGEDGSAVNATKGNPSGMFRPETNTIFIDANIGMNTHTVLHEMAHAATSAALANPNLPEVKQLQVLLKAAREQLGDVYGTKNLDEFVAEAFGNPEFQRALALMSVDGGKMAGWKKFASAVMRTIRKAIGFKPKPPESPLDDIDNIIMGLLTPAPATRGAPDMFLLGRTAKGATQLLRKHITAVPLKEKSVKGFYEQTRDFVSTNSPGKLRRFVLAVQPVNNLARLAEDRISYANDLNVLIDETSGKLREAFCTYRRN